MFHSACTNLDVDIITLDLTVRLPFPLKAGYLRQALGRGVTFEVLYGPLVADAAARRNIIGNVRMMMRLALRREGGLVVSSGGEAAWQLRAPADVLNLTGLLGVPSHAKGDCLRGTPEKVIMHAATRKHTYRSAISIIPTLEGGSNSTDLLDDFIEFK